MRKETILGSGLFAVVLGMSGLAGCSSSSSGGTTQPHDAATKSDTGTTKTDGGAGKPETGTTKPDAIATAETGTGSETSTATGGVHLLVTYQGSTSGTVFAVNLATKAIDGQVTTSDSDPITDTSNALAPFLVNQGKGTIDRIDPNGWTIDGSLTTAYATDAGLMSPYPNAVMAVSATEAYVTAFDSNTLDVFNLTTPVDAGAPTSSIDLSSVYQATESPDPDVHMVAQVYVASSKRLYVVLGNIDTYATDDYMGNYDTICEKTVSSVIAIDTTTNAIVSLGGTAPGGGIALSGYDPTSAVYDAAGSRLLIFEAGCNPAPEADGGAPGPTQLRGIEEVDLTSNTSKILLDASTQGFPGNLVYIDKTHAVVGFSYPSYVAYSWDPTTSSLGAVLPNAPQVFDLDGNGNLVGASINYSDAGTGSLDVVSMSLATGAATTVKANVVPNATGFLGSVGVWPRP